MSTHAFHLHLLVVTLGCPGSVGKGIIVGTVPAASWQLGDLTVTIVQSAFEHSKTKILVTWWRDS